jgi:hypothetical protein
VEYSCRLRGLHFAIQYLTWSTTVGRVDCNFLGSPVVNVSDRLLADSWLIGLYCWPIGHISSSPVVYVEHHFADWIGISFSIQYLTWSSVLYLITAVLKCFVECLLRSTSSCTSWRLVPVVRTFTGCRLRHWTLLDQFGRLDCCLG